MSVRGVKQYVMREPELLHIARLDGAVPKGITGAITAGNSAGFTRAKGITSFNETIPESDIRTVLGDGGTVTQYLRPSDAPMIIDGGVAVFDQTILTALDGRTIYTEGAWEISQRTPTRCKTYNNIGAILSGRLISLEAGTIDEQGWWTILYWNLTAEVLGNAFQIGQEAPVSLRFSINKAEQTWWEEDLNTNYNTDESISTDPITADYPIMAHTYAGDGTSSQTFTLDYTPSAQDANSNRLWEDGTQATYTTDFTVTANTKTVAYEVAGDPANSSDNVLLYEYIAPC